MNVPLRVKVLGFELETTISQETANKIAVGLVGTVASVAVMAVGAACRNPTIVGIGGRMAVASISGAGIAVGVEELTSQLQQLAGAKTAAPGATPDPAT